MVAPIRPYPGHGGVGKPVIVSECGVGAIPGYSDPTRRARWIEEAQADILQALVQAYAFGDRLSGLSLRQICNVLVGESWAISRPRC